ncbi:hypothetical protein [Ewingella americana]|uniref:Uncharacterized protein n=1 Tax=Ewingella americana TaxID=41202 RepID=A0A502GHZ2_9GAMM|nr:hypothetical protein [Ewingella americana]TPG61485.1 hypothetical protein EAH77_12650 [Ewingella americana]
MATKFQVELALKAVLLELHVRGVDLHSLQDASILRMHNEKIFVKEDSSKERYRAEEVLFGLVHKIAGAPPQSNEKPLPIEEF